MSIQVKLRDPDEKENIVTITRLHKETILRNMTPLMYCVDKIDKINFSVNLKNDI